MIDTKKLLGYLNLLAELVEKTKGDTETKSTTSPITKETTIENIGKAYYTIKVKTRLLKEIAEAVKKAEEIKDDASEEDWKSLLISVDNLVNIIKTSAKELKDHKELLKTNEKIDGLTHKVIVDMYGADRNAEHVARDDDDSKEKDEKKKEEDEFKKSLENAYMKLMEKLAKVGESIWTVFRDTTYRSVDEKNDNEKKVKLLDSILKKLKREVPSEEISDDEAKKLLQLVVRLRENSMGTDYSGAVDTLTKAVAKHIQKAAVKNESETFDIEMLLETAGKGKRIAVSYETWSEEDVDDGDTDNRGWEDEEGVDFTDEDEPVKEAISFLKEKGATNASSSHFGKGVWYSSEDDVDMKTGDRTIYSYHLYGWTKDEEQKIFDAIVNKKALTESYYDAANWLL